MNSKFVTVLLAVGLLICCLAECAPQLPQAKESSGSCVCPYIYAPVCASDGQTYGNERCMKCDHPALHVTSQGPCPGEAKQHDVHSYPPTEPSN